MSQQEPAAPVTQDQVAQLQDQFDAKLEELRAMVAQMKRENARMQEIHEEIIGLRARSRGYVLRPGD